MLPCDPGSAGQQFPAFGYDLSFPTHGMSLIHRDVEDTF